ncbi:hypothetical protein [Rhizobium leguminosarum]
MAFAKAQDLIRLARLAAAGRRGISLEEISAEFGVSHRTAQRMTEALDQAFGNVLVEEDEDRKRRWRLVDPMLDRMQLRHESAVEALEIAARAAEAEGRLRHTRALLDLREGMLAKVPKRARVEADAEAVLAAMGQVTRPGPRVTVSADILDAIIEALRGPFRLSVRSTGIKKNASLNRMGSCSAIARILLHATQAKQMRYATSGSTSSMKRRPSTRALQ